MERDDRARIERAFGYPYPVPPYSYHYEDGTDAPIAEADFTDRTPVIAYGSNASPAQLHRKFGEARIPVTRAVLHGFDVVWAARFAHYGSVPATICPSEGTDAFVHATWLSPSELQAMHETEGEGADYRYEPMPAKTVTLSDAPVVDEVFVYVAIAGPLGPEPTALGTVPARNRRFPSAEQPAILRRVRDELAPGMSLEEFVLSIVASSEFRRERAAHLRRLTA